MPANVETMFSVKQTPWHKLGVVIAEAPSIAEGIKLAGLDWDVTSESLVRADGSNVDEFARVFVRSDNKKTLGVVGPKTYPLQNALAFAFFQPFLDNKEAALETAGSLDEGRKVWIMAKINRDNSVIVPGDEVAKFVLVSNAHDGTTAVRIGFTPIRVVCANTLALAHGDKASKLIRVRHSKSVEQNVESIRDIMNVADEQFEATAEQFRFLASRDISVADLTKYVKTVFKMDEEKTTTRATNILNGILAAHEAKTHMVADMLIRLQEREKAEASANKNLLDAVIEATTANFESGKGTENVRSRGTWWTAYNSINEYLNYERGHNDDTRLNSLWFGQNATANKLALEVATDMATGKDVKTA